MYTTRQLHSPFVPTPSPIIKHSLVRCPFGRLQHLVDSLQTERNSLEKEGRTITKKQLSCRKQLREIERSMEELALNRKHIEENLVVLSTLSEETHAKMNHVEEKLSGIEMQSSSIERQLLRQHEGSKLSYSPRKIDRKRKSQHCIHTATGNITSVFLLEGNVLMWGGEDGCIRGISLKSLVALENNSIRARGALEELNYWHPAHSNGYIRALDVVETDDSVLLFVAYGDGSVCSFMLSCPFNVGSGKCELADTFRFVNAAVTVLCTTLVANRVVLLIGTTEGVVHLFDVHSETGKMVKNEEKLVHSEVENSISGLQASSYAVATTCIEDGSVRMWDTKTCECRRVIVAHGENGITAMKFDESVLATAGYDYVVRVWDLRSGSCIYSSGIMSECVSSLTLFDDYVAYAAGKDIIVTEYYEPECSELSRVVSTDTVLSGHSAHVTVLRYDSERGVLISASSDSTVRLWATG